MGSIYTTSDVGCDGRAVLLTHDDAGRCTSSTGFLEDRGDGVAERPVCLVVWRHCEQMGTLNNAYREHREEFREEEQCTHASGSIGEVETRVAHHR